MKILRNLIILFVIVVIILWGISFLLSRKYTVERSVLIKAPVDTVFGYVEDLHKWKYWSPWLTRAPDAVITYHSNQGNHARLLWKSRSTGDGEVRINTIEPGRRITYSLSVEGFETRIHGEFLFQSTNGTTKIKWIDNGDLGPSPLSKYYILLIENTIGSEFEKGLQDLKKVIEKPVPAEGH